MERFFSSFLSLFFLISLVGCSVKSNETRTPSSFIQSKWKAGDSWRIEVTYWPERLDNPYTKNSTSKQEDWLYKVHSGRERTDEPRIIVKNPGDTFLLTFNKSKNLLRVDEVLQRSPDYWKTRKILSSPTGSEAFLAPSWKPDRPVFWVHPDLSELDTFKRYRLSSERLSGNWVTQKIKQDDSTLTFVLNHKPSNSRVIFRWSQGQEWWSEARYFKKGRLILRARGIGSIGLNSSDNQ